MDPNIERLGAALHDRYRMIGPLGAGGMATVYRAHDLRHDRDVAIKVLHPDLGAALGGERFLSEIRTTARLQHPHILPLLDSGAADSLLYYVMPLVTGETLRARLERERQLPVDDAVRLAREVAAALEHAHRQGVIHRDIKPENILLQDGSALVADFGIALAVQQAGGQRLTQTGLSLGTPQYMSPEQAMGERTIDARSDQYALAAVLYEMLVGEPPFTGPSVQAIVARLLSEEPRGLTSQRKAIPDAVNEAVLRGLEKLPADRFATMADFALALEGRGSTTTRSTRATPSTSRARIAPLSVGLSLVAVAASGVAAWSLTRPVPEPEVIRYRVLADSVSAERTWTSDVNISPDGALIVRRGGPGGRVIVRRRDALGFEELPGTEEAMGVVFSPDGSRIVFYQEGRLVTMPTTGGPVTVIADSMTSPEAVAWGTDGYIYRGADQGALIITKCPETNCRRPEPFSVLDSTNGEMAHMHPEVLPDGAGVLYQAEFTSGARKIVLQKAGARTHSVITEGVRARFVRPGHLLYTTSDGKLWVSGFDLEAGQLTGEPRLVAENLPQSIIGPVDFAVSATGTLVYSEERDAGARELVWVTREGRETPFDSTWRASFSTPVLSRDGRQLAVAIRESSRSAIWIRRADGAPVRVTSERNANEPAWSPDGRVLSFLAAGDRANTGNVWRLAVAGSDVARLMVRSDRPLSEQVWRPDGSALIVRTTTPTAGAGDLLIAPIGGDSSLVPYITSAKSEYSPAVSPDGRWMAWASNVSGRFEVYVADAASPTTSRVLVSSGGGSSPRWAPDGRALYYLDNGSQLIEAKIATAPALHVEGLRKLFDARFFVQTSLSRRNYDVAPDGRFLFVRRSGNAQAGSIVVVEHWTRELAPEVRR